MNVYPLAIGFKWKTEIGKMTNTRESEHMSDELRVFVGKSSGILRGISLRQEFLR